MERCVCVRVERREYECVERCEYECVCVWKGVRMNVRTCAYV